MYSPEIETATRFTTLGEGSTFTLTETKEKLKATYTVADSCFFDVLSLDVLQGDPEEILSSPLQAMVSESVARNIGGDAVGKTIVLDQGFPGKLHLQLSGHARFHAFDFILHMGRLDESSGERQVHKPDKGQGRS